MMDKQAARAAMSATVLVLAGLAAAPAQAETYKVEIRGSVEYNMIGGGLAGIGAGTPVLMSFTVDSNNYVNSVSWPTRGYIVAPGSFTMDIGGVAVTLENPQPEGAQAMFVLRNNDPAVDGFFLSLGTDYRFPLAALIPGRPMPHELEFARTFDSTTTLSSLDIADAVGHYGWEDMSSYQMTLGMFGNIGLEAMYESITISAVPEPGAMLMFGMGGLLLLGRLRRREASAG